MKRLLAIGLAAAFVMPAQAKQPKSWTELINDPKVIKSPTMQETHVRAVRATGDIQLFKVADRYGFLFDQDGYAVAVFDYTMDPMTRKDMLLGSVGIGGWSFKNLWNKYKKMKETPTDIIDKDVFIDPGNYPLPDENNERDWTEFYGDFEKAKADGVVDGKEIEKGYKEFAKLKFNDEWIAKHGHLRVAGNNARNNDERSGFLPASFAMSDLYLDQKQSEKMFATMNQFSKIFYQHELTPAEAPAFMTQFQMNWQESKKEFNMLWAPSATTVAGEKPPPIPGFVLYYYDIYYLLSYKYALNNLDRNAALLETVLGKYGALMGIFVSRITNGLRSQMDYHENSLLTILEAYQRGEYDLNVPWEDGHSFVDQSITLLYLNKMIESKDLDVTDGVAKRQLVEEKEAKNKENVLKWLAKKKYDVRAWSDGRHATVFKGDKRKGIVNLVINRHWLTRQPSFMHYDGATWYKGAQRVFLELFVDAVRMVMPTQLDFGKWLAAWFNVNISIYMPTVIWDGLFRGRQFTEIAYEAMVFSKVNEAIAGRWAKVPGYEVDELPLIKNTLAVQRMNTFEVPLKYEQIAIKTNYKYVLDLIGQGITDYHRILP